MKLKYLILGLISAHGFLSASCPADVKPRPIFRESLKNAIWDDKAKRILQFINENPDNVNAVSSDGTPILQYALQTGAYLIAELLIMRGADLTHNTFNLFLAVFENPGQKTDFLQLLIDNHADVNAQSETGVTPLMLAAELNDLAAAQYLIDRGANITPQTKQGRNFYPWGITDQMKKLLEKAEEHTKKQEGNGKKKSIGEGNVTT